MQLDSFYPQYSPPLASLQTVVEKTSRDLQVSWFGLVCGASPVMTLGLRDTALPLSGWTVGQDLTLRVPVLDSGNEKEGPVVEFQCRLAEIRDWYGKVMLKAQLLKAAGPGRQMVGRALNQLCQGGGWKNLL